jgi:hypothetical protein
VKPKTSTNHHEAKIKSQTDSFCSALPRDHRRHEPDSIPGYKALSAAGESRDYHGPLRGPGPLDNCLFPAGDPV